MALEHGYGYYYMGATASACPNGSKLMFPGYYIHSCPKMRYKRDFKPTSVLGRCSSSLLRT